MIGNIVFHRFAALICALTITAPAAVYAQDYPPPPPDQQQQPGPAVQPISPEQLDSLVAPIALYPDSLLSQVLVASTYPLELVEANQWLGQNGGLQGQGLVDAAKQQNWDPSVQALVVFPDVVRRLTQDIRWTTSLGNAFLAQEADVMSSVQRMRASAQQAGKLQSTPQQQVITQNQGGQPVIEIEPTNPEVIYVPTYNPVYVWGPPAYGYYPPLYYPGVGVGFGFGYGISIGAFFGGGWGGGWGGWGWHPNWGGRTIIVNNNFFHRYGYNDFHGGRDFGRGSAVWSHAPEHRLGVPYADRNVAAQYRGGGGNGNFGRSFAQPSAPQQQFNGGRNFSSTPQQNFDRGNFGRSAPAQREAPRSEAPQQNFDRGGFGRNSIAPQAPRTEAPQRFSSPQPEQRGFEQRNSGGNHSAFGGVQDGGRTRMESDHGFNSMRSAPAPRASAPAPAFRGGGGGGGERGGGGGHRR